MRLHLLTWLKTCTRITFKSTVKDSDISDIDQGFKKFKTTFRVGQHTIHTPCTFCQFRIFNWQI